MLPPKTAAQDLTLALGYIGCSSLPQARLPVDNVALESIGHDIAMAFNDLWRVTLSDAHQTTEQPARRRSPLQTWPL